jgi:hypothetical protein
MSDPQHLNSPFNDPKNPQPLTNTNKGRPSIHNRTPQLNNPKSVEPNRPVVTPTQQPISALPLRRRKPNIAPHQTTPPTPTEYAPGAIIRTNGGKKHKRTYKRRINKRRTYKRHTHKKRN